MNKWILVLMSLLIIASIVINWMTDYPLNAKINITLWITIATLWLFNTHVAWKTIKGKDKTIMALIKELTKPK